MRTFAGNEDLRGNQELQSPSADLVRARCVGYLRPSRADPVPLANAWPFTGSCEVDCASLATVLGLVEQGVREKDGEARKDIRYFDAVDNTPSRTPPGPGRLAVATVQLQLGARREEIGACPDRPKGPDEEYMHV